MAIYKKIYQNVGAIADCWDDHTDVENSSQIIKDVLSVDETER